MSTAIEKSTTQQTRGEIEYTPIGGMDPIKLNAKLVQRFLVKPTKSGQMPTEEDCTRFIMLCKARRLNPWEGDAFLVGYDGQGGAEFSLITSIQAILKRAEVCEDYDGKESGVIVQDKDGNIVDRIGDFMLPKDALLGGWCKAYSKKHNRPEEKRVTLGAFQKNTKFWARDPAGMICKCAEADALRAMFPTALGSMITEMEANRNAIEVDSHQVKRPQFLTAPKAEHPTGFLTHEQKDDVPFDSDPPKPPKPKPENAGDAVELIEICRRCKSANIAVETVVEFCHQTGTDETLTTLGEITMMDPGALKRALKEWAVIVKTDAEAKEVAE